MTDKGIDVTLLRWEDNLQYWEKLHKVLQEEPALEEFRPMYGMLAALGIEQGKPFAPDARMKAILEQAAKAGRAQMLVAGFGSSRPDRVVWTDRKWEWAALRYENGDFELPTGIDVEARDRWFSQAVAASPKMFLRTAGAGSLYWLGLRDKNGAYLDGGKTYKLSVPQPVPQKLFWSVTVYDSATTFANSNGSRQGRAAVTGRVEGCGDDGRDRPLLRPQRAGWQRKAVDQNQPRQGLVCLLPPVWAGRTGLRWKLEAGRLRGDRATIDRAGIAVNSSSSSIGG